ncbi:MAG: hypothetical protein PHV34_02975 [Verrucomicrobiae bacterium]|nr:hypothetical protein [Verrucomicrobiae bacterium]
MNKKKAAPERDGSTPNARSAFALRTCAFAKASASQAGETSAEAKNRQGGAGAPPSIHFATNGGRGSRTAFFAKY